MKQLVLHVEEAADVLPWEAAAYGPFPVDECQGAIGEPLHIPGSEVAVFDERGKLGRVL
jgi:hypothetical protein